MTMMRRRYFLFIATLLLAARTLRLPAGVALAQQGLDIPQVRRSEAEPMVRKYVDLMSDDAKKHTGVELSQQQKTELVNSILSEMENRGIYGFIDP
jgi:hypothetical protein